MQLYGSCLLYYLTVDFSLARPKYSSALMCRVLKVQQLLTLLFFTIINYEELLKGYVRIDHLDTIGEKHFHLFVL